ncbi:MAG: TIGR04283 family arsenosugar biosynthesis glycosyltransferase [Methylococcales bacterium]|nr:TIGR04283 family arsenosugar biosynthesis glycosyltransferase [Methylococcales bacterium]
MYKKFSIIIPTFNEEPIIKKCLLALQPLRQQATLIIADGGSQDKTLSMATPLVDKIVHADKGRAKQMNAAAKLAQSEVLIFLHADTFLPDNALTLIEQGLHSNKHWGRFNINLTGPSVLKIISQMMNWRSSLTGIATGDQVIFVRQTLFEYVKGYPEIALMEDIALSKKLKSESTPFCLKDKVQSSGRRWQQFGLFQTILLMWNLRLRYWLGQSPDKLAKLYYQEQG